MTAAALDRPSRVRALDGMRGAAIVVIVLSHIWIAYDLPDSAAHPWQVLLASGNFAVSIFFVMGGFIATSAMLGEVERTGRLRYGVVVLRRWLRLSAHLYPLVLAVLLVAAVGVGTAPYDAFDTGGTARAVLSYVWPWYLEHNPAQARPDLGHLWFVAADFWGIALVAVVVALLRRRPHVLLATLLVLIVAVTMFRDHTFHTYGEFLALLRVPSRIDGILWGAVAAVVAPWTRRYVTRPHLTSGLALVLLVPLAFWVFDIDAYFGLGGVVLNVTLAVLVSTLMLFPTSRFVSAVLDRRPLRVLGRLSFGIYLWHYPVLWYVSSNQSDWSSPSKATVGLAATVVLAYLTTHLVERPVQTWLGAPVWRHLDGGIPQAVNSLVRRPARGREAVG